MGRRQFPLVFVNHVIGLADTTHSRIDDIVSVIEKRTGGRERFKIACSRIIHAVIVFFSFFGSPFPIDLDSTGPKYQISVVFLVIQHLRSPTVSRFVTGTLHDIQELRLTPMYQVGRRSISDMRRFPVGRPYTMPHAFLVLQ